MHTGKPERLTVRGIAYHLVTILLLCTTVQQPAQGAVLNLERFTEVLQQDAPVVGSGPIRGITRLNQVSSVAPDELVVVLPPGPAARLCVIAESQDAQYYAEIEYRVGARSNEEKVTLDFPTRYGSAIARFAPRDFGVSVILASSCQNRNGTYLPITWGETTGDRYLVLVNAGGPYIDVSLFYRDNSKYYSCTRDGESALLTAFDAECELELSSRQRGSGVWVITRERNGEFLSDDEIKVYLP